jgi:1-phosphatidylinositol-4-phosphate 5-kinase
MIKTVKKEEAKAFLEMLPQYHRFMSDRKNGRNSLLTRVFGMYSVQFLNEKSARETKWNGGLYSPKKHETTPSDLVRSDEERVFLVMNSIFPAEASAFITERFDLKGSTVGRQCSLEEQQVKGANAVLKDLNLKREVDAERDKFTSSNDSRTKRKHDYGIHIGRKRKAALMAQLEKDVELLNRCGVLDYSLLVGCADMEKASNMSNLKPMNNAKYITNSIHKALHWMDSPMPYYGSGMTKVDGGHLSSLRGTRRGKQVTYYMGIIDFLQPWTIKKRLERDIKGLAGYDTTAISCVAPSDYATRFLKFIEAHIT